MTVVPRGKQRPTTKLLSKCGDRIIEAYASDESQCVQPQPFHCAISQCIMNNTTLLSFAVGRSRFHNKEGTDRDIHCLDYDHVGEGDKFCTDQVVYSGNDGR